ncbi:DUF3450 domain-containing protein [Agarivorans sp. MS3-6]|uniref:DUF3450 domain-containing protein n=1 Tax=Agarivorans sp. TSD2052 TaxID=2937286 RepID=UPI00200BAA3A|nr:DUF3450 domain-containing protein [Agarivorans sp. TSD2052]UPW19302.1 DUF3450 domain-containing protein [Agarivorans sp. TSD2052]
MRRFILLLILAMTAKSALADGVIEQQLHAQEINQQSQLRIDELDAQRQIVSEKSRSIRQQAEIIEQYNQYLAAMISQQQQELSQLKKDMVSIDDSEQQVLPLVHDMLQKLSAFIAKDLPFLAQERQQRLHRLNQLLARADVTLAEKYRQVLEAYQIEMEYGDTIEAYSAPLGQQQVNYFRLGRTAWYYQTLNGQNSALWDPIKQQWQVLSQAENLALSDAMAIAWQQQAPSLIHLPLNLALPEVNNATN